MVGWKAFWWHANSPTHPAINNLILANLLSTSKEGWKVPFSIQLVVLWAFYKTAALRQCAVYACLSYAGAGKACAWHIYVAFAVEAVWCVRRECRSLGSTTYIYLRWAYLSVSDCVTHIWPIPMALGRVQVCNDIPHDIPECDLPRMYVSMYVRTYFVRIDPRFRASS